MDAFLAQARCREEMSHNGIMAGPMRIVLKKGGMVVGVVRKEIKNKLGERR